MSLLSLPIRLASPPREASATQGTLQNAPAFEADAGPDPRPSIAENVNGPVSHVSMSELTASVTATGPSSHQFCLKDAKIAEDLFTIHRSAKHLVDFTASIIGNRDLARGSRPIPVMSDGDVLFMTELSNDIARSVGGVAAERQHGTRTKKRKAAQAYGSELHFVEDYTPCRRLRPPSRGESRGHRASGSKRVHISKDEDVLSCSMCARTETPEWRRGPDGLLCNVCGLVYAKQRTKFKDG